MGAVMHTPGPWEVHAEPINPLYRGIIGLGSEPNQEKPWAVVAKRDIDRPAYDILANARLISAAPDMLEALESIMLEFGPGTMSDEAFGKAVAAISKAKGETT